MRRYRRWVGYFRREGLGWRRSVCAAWWWRHCDVANYVNSWRTDRSARVLTYRAWPWVVVSRTKADGSLDWFTYHLTRSGARRAASRYVRDGVVTGFRP